MFKKLAIISILCAFSTSSLADMIPRLQLGEDGCSLSYYSFQERASQDVYKYKCSDKKKLEKLFSEVVKESIYSNLRKNFLGKISNLLKLININIYYIDIDLEDIIINIHNDEETNEVIKEIKKMAINNNNTLLAYNIDKVLEQKIIWGFRSGEYTFQENVLLEAGMQAFYELLDNELLSNINDKKIKVEAIGYTDNQPITGTISYYSDINRQASTIECRKKSKDDIKKSFPSLGILFSNNTAINRKNVTRKIGNSIQNNCELSYARGYEAIYNLKKYDKAFNPNQLEKITYVYSGNGVNLSEKIKQKQRKVLFRISQYKH